MKPKARPKRRTYTGKWRPVRAVSHVRQDQYWQNRSGDEPPIAGSSLIELEKKLAQP